MPECPLVSACAVNHVCCNPVLHPLLSAGTSMTEFCVAHRSEIQALQLDVRRFVCFATLHGFLRNA